MLKIALASPSFYMLFAASLVRSRHLQRLQTMSPQRTMLTAAAVVRINADAALQEVITTDGQSRSVGKCEVYCKGDSLFLERKQERGNIQSEWLLRERRTNDYAAVMASEAQAALAGNGQQQQQSVLMLGLGGGTIGGQILQGDRGQAGVAGWSDEHRRLRVTAIESDADVCHAASRYFLPSMFDDHGDLHNPQHPTQSLVILHADAIAFVEGAVSLTGADVTDAGAGPFDVIVEDFAYESPGRLRAPFWCLLRQRLAARSCTLVANTLYPRRAQLDILAQDLRGAGWEDVRWRVEHGQWQPNKNAIFCARTPSP